MLAEIRITKLYLIIFLCMSMNKSYTDCGKYNSVIHSFIMHSVNPYKVNQRIGYRVCHNANVI